MLQDLEGEAERGKTMTDKKMDKNIPEIPVKGMRSVYCPNCCVILPYRSNPCWKCNQKIDWNNGRRFPDEDQKWNRIR